MITYPLNRIEYQATDAELFHVTRTSGIYAGDHFGYSITGADNNITIDIGIAWIKNGFFNGKVAANTEPEIIDCGIADASLPRWDIICVQFDKNENATAIVVKKGTPASAPIVPAVEQAETVFELCLYRIYRPAGSVAIVPENIYDTRLDPNVCGLMADSVTSVDTEAINAQVNALIRKLNQAITDTAAGVGEVNEYIQSGDVDNLILDGVGTNGKFKSLVDGTVTTATVNSETYTVNAGSENEIELASNSWYLFVLDTERKTINFNQGGAGLNFKVVGGTAQPASPKENTVWINTSAAVNGYIFSPTEPENPAEGMVWIKTCSASSANFDALKKNGIRLFLGICKQWNGNEWEEKNAYCYQNGQWNVCDGITEVTGATSLDSLYKNTDSTKTVTYTATVAGTLMACIMGCNNKNNATITFTCTCDNDSVEITEIFNTRQNRGDATAGYVTGRYACYLIKNVAVGDVITCTGNAYTGYPLFRVEVFKPTV